MTLWRAPGRVVARSGACWTSLGALVLARVVLPFIDGKYWHAQESEREVTDKVVHG
jgi:hypothetical protein